jgi:hypothetical protein
MWNDVKAVETVLEDSHLDYSTVNSRQLEILQLGRGATKSDSSEIEVL